MTVVSFPIPPGAIAIKRLIQTLDEVTGPMSLIDETGHALPEAIAERVEQLVARKQAFLDQYEGEPRRKWEVSIRAQAQMQAVGEADVQIGRWIKARMKLEYTREEERQLDMLNRTMMHAPCDRRGTEIFRAASLEHAQIRDRARERAIRKVWVP